MQVKIKKLHPDAVIPTYATPGSAGFDLVAVEETIIEPGETAKIPLGLAFEIPKGYEMQIRPRSGVSLHTKLRQSNSIGTIDSDYRGEVCMMFDNTNENYDSATCLCFSIAGDEIHVPNGYGFLPEGSYIIRKGDRVAQGIITPVIQASFVEVDELSDTKRGTGGFGSTGVRSNVK
ncbi:dUTP diphosphatase [Brevibacillus laterosporus]|uniref:dUTP diphosphatase n=1 Tax=Brevibacillus laterosporus TaxID=1465 RepID=UPI000EAE12E9|nr:deoxyuridine 5'-triphosphate nucleotidohydrolase [Brevibacillus laterosporus]AYK08885.1 deoxyuridine 5'-triphosphate nucleotidohydrolase [Brevibacillus laterosporus]